MTKPEAMKIVCVLFGSFPNSRFNEQNFESYAESIQDLDASTCGAAVQRLIRTSKFLPSLAEIREATTAQRVGPCARGEEAYAALLMAKRRHGYDYGRVDAWRRLKDPLFAEPHIQECLTMFGGWNAFALDDDEAPSRARFIAMYDELTRRERADLVSGQPLPAPALDRARNNRAALALVSSKGAGSGADALADAREAAPRSAPADILVPMAPPRPQPPPAREHRRWTPEELDAELARRAGGAP